MFLGPSIFPSNIWLQTINTETIQGVGNDERVLPMWKREIQDSSHKASCYLSLPLYGVSKTISVRIWDLRNLQSISSVSFVLRAPTEPVLLHTTDKER